MAFATAASLSIGAMPTHAVNTLAYTFIVDCADPTGTSSDEVAPITFPTGTYAVTITGACTYGTLDTTTIATPCSTPAGTVPCADVHNVPMPCALATGGVANEYYDCTTLAPSCELFRVEIDGQCATFDNAGFIYHTTPGAMNARFLDAPGCYVDNVGAFLVTVVWTPL